MLSVIFLGSWLLINFKCLFKRDTTWDKIEHVRSIKINEVSNEKNSILKYIKRE